jgi:hypothetical protein
MPVGSDGVPDPFIGAARSLAAEAQRLMKEKGLSLRGAFTEVAERLDEPYRGYALDCIRALLADA